MIYIYKRDDGSTFEINQRMSEEPLTTCPETGQSVRRVITGGAGVQMKGWWPGKVADANARHQKGLANDPLYTTLSDYKPKVDEFNETHERNVTRKIMVPT
jgi:putative FmdB family regulatory protein